MKVSDHNTLALCSAMDVYRGGDDLGGDALQQAVAKDRAVDGRVQIHCPSLPLQRRRER